MLSLTVLACLLSLAGAFTRSNAQFSSFWSRGHGTGSNLLASMLGAHGSKTDSVTSVREDLKSTIDEGPIPKFDREFMINGWRWHMGSVLRDLERYRIIIDKLQIAFREAEAVSTREAAEESAKNGGQPLCADTNNHIALRSAQAARSTKCYEFVCGFNWKALMRVERELFFPWLEGLLPASAKPLMEQVLGEHVEINRLSDRLKEKCTAFQSAIETNSADGNDVSTSLQHLAFLYSIDEVLTEMQQVALRVQEVQQNVFVPYVAAYVTRGEQERFNRRVIARLGLIDSQVHLVSMYDYTDALPTRKELHLFKAQIPRVAQAVLPVWRKRLYMPKAACLDATTIV